MLNVFVSTSFSHRPLCDSRSGPSRALVVSHSCMCLCVSDSASGCFCTPGRLSRSHADPRLALVHRHTCIPTRTAVKERLTGSFDAQREKSLDKKCNSVRRLLHNFFFFSSQNPTDPICHHLPYLPFQIVHTVLTQIHIGLAHFHLY